MSVNDDLGGIAFKRGTRVFLSLIPYVRPLDSLYRVFSQSSHRWIQDK